MKHNRRAFLGKVASALGALVGFKKEPSLDSISEIPCDFDWWSHEVLTIEAPVYGPVYGLYSMELPITNKPVDFVSAPLQEAAREHTNEIRRQLLVRGLITGSKNSW